MYTHYLHDSASVITMCEYVLSEMVVNAIHRERWAEQKCTETESAREGEAGAISGAA